MILVDTSVWIDYFNNVDSPHSSALDLALIDGSVAIGDIIFLEILQGFKSDKDYKNTKAQLSKLDQYEMFGNHMVELCANNYRSLRKKGVTIRGTADVIIATFCIERPLHETNKQRPQLFEIIEP
ncbi:MAG: PIN domain-containing protein, partial [Cycloclasticus sp.]|nr:PIN domain-containing protein [Cycloclasticus sp.]